MLDSGNTFSYTQLLLDNETIRMIRRALQGITVSDISLAVDLFAKVQPGGHFLAEQHTIDHMHQEQTHAEIFAREVRDSWEKAGARSAASRAREEVHKLLAEHEVEPLPEKIQRKLSQIVRS